MALTQRQIETAMPWLFVGGTLVLWELGCIIFSLKVFVLPRPTVVAQSLWKWAGPIFENAMHTMASTLAGFGLAVIGGLLLGIAIGSSRTIYRGLYPVLIGFNSVPKVAVVPVFVIWFGAGPVPAVLTAFLVSFFPIAVNVAAGLATVEPELIDVLRSLGASKFDVLRKVGLPRSMPYFFASLKVGVTLAFVGAIISETVAGRNGIGYLMMAATSNFDTPLVFAGLFVTSVMGVLMYALFAVFERRMTFWAHRSQEVVE